jgi:hypothetical protein
VKAKVTGVVVLFCLAFGFARAQVFIGPVAGGSFSWSSFGDKDLKDDYKLKPVWGYHAGAQLTFRVRKRFFLHTSVLYATKGKVLEGKNEALELKARYNYIDIPIVYTVHFKGNIGKKPFKYFLGIGPDVSYWLGGKGSIENTDTHEFGENGSVVDYSVVFYKDPDQAGENDMVVKKPNRVQLGLNITAGLAFEPARDREMFLTFRYELGHSFLSRETNGAFKPTYFEDPMNIRNHGIRISLAYMIDLKIEQRKKGKSTINKKKM